MNQGERFRSKLGATEGEILGVYPEGQSTSVNMPGGAYQIMIRGFRGVISKQLFDVIFQSGDIPAIIEAENTHVIHGHENKRRKKVT